MWLVENFKFPMWFILYFYWECSPKPFHREIGFPLIGTSSSQSKLGQEIHEKVLGFSIYAATIWFEYLSQRCQTHSHQGPHQPQVAFRGPSVILGLYKRNYSLTVKRELGSAAWQKQGAGLDKNGGGLDSAHGPGVCHLWSKGHNAI